MEDLIKREDAIKAVAQDLMYESCIQSEYASDELSDWIEVAKVMLEEVPSADRPQGEWICHEGGWKGLDYYPTKYECDQCHHYVDVASDKKFCPNCGARMKGADDE